MKIVIFRGLLPASLLLGLVVTGASSTDASRDPQGCVHMYAWLLVSALLWMVPNPLTLVKRFQSRSPVASWNEATVRFMFVLQISIMAIFVALLVHWLLAPLDNLSVLLVWVVAAIYGLVFALGMLSTTDALMDFWLERMP